MSVITLRDAQVLLDARASCSSGGGSAETWHRPGEDTTWEERQGHAQISIELAKLTEHWGPYLEEAILKKELQTTSVVRTLAPGPRATTPA